MNQKTFHREKSTQETRYVEKERKKVMVGTKVWNLYYLRGGDVTNQFQELKVTLG